MIMPKTSNTLEGTAAIQSFGIEMNESMFNMLTKNVYTDTKLAVIREWSTNAIDACKAAGLPIKFTVKLPTILSPKFSVRDYGTGLEADEVGGLFAMLGASTKRQSNEFNGTFGIGRMAGLAYTDSFTVDSYKDGLKMSYVVSTDSGIPQIISLGNMATDEPNGLELAVNVDPKDSKDFIQKATRLYNYFETKPIVSPELNYPEKDIVVEADDWFLEKSTSYHGSYPLAIMGDVAYSFPFDDLNTAASALSNINIRIKVPLGAISITPGRESLSMDDKTIKYLETRLVTISKEIGVKASEHITKITSKFDRAVAYNQVNKMLPYGVHAVSDSKLDTKLFSFRFSETSLLTNVRDNLTMKHLNIYHKKFSDMTGSAKVIDVNDKLQFMISDTRVNVLAAALEKRATVEGSEVVILSPIYWDKNAVQDHIDEAKKYLKAIGVTEYSLSSEYVSTPTSKATKAEGFYPLHIGLSDTNTFARKGYNLVDTFSDIIPTYYVETSGYTITNIDNEELTACLQYASMYNGTMSKEPGFARINIVGVPKKYMAIVKNDPRFTYLPGAFKLLTNKPVIYDRTQVQDLLEFIDSFLGSKVSTVIAEFGDDRITDMFKVLTAFSLKSNSQRYYTITMSTLEKFTGCTIEAPLNVYTVDNFKADYPLLGSMLRRGLYYFDKEALKHYKDLEDFKRSNS